MADNGADWQWTTIPAPGEWTDDAACVGYGDSYTAERKPEPDELSVLERVCRRCPVARECGDYARIWPVVGMWAGRWYTEGDRLAAVVRVVDVA